LLEELWWQVPHLTVFICKWEAHTGPAPSNEIPSISSYCCLFIEV
jgi:hypothetical protein